MTTFVISEYNPHIKRVHQKRGKSPKFVTQNITVATIGIGASKYCDGQILVFDDLIGLNPMNYKFVKKYAKIRNDISKAVSNYSKEVRKIKFPNKKNSF